MKTTCKQFVPELFRDKLSPAEFVEVTGDQIVPGLVVHMASYYGPRKVWFITHIPSGKRISSGFTKRFRAMGAALELRGLGNWNVSETEVQHLGPGIEMIIRKWDGILRKTLAAAKGAKP